MEARRALEASIFLMLWRVVRVVVACELMCVVLSETVDATLTGPRRTLASAFTMEDLVNRHLRDEGRKGFRRTETRKESVDLMLKAANDLNTNQLSLEHVNPHPISRRGLDMMESSRYPQAARVWARPPFRHFKIQSCCCLGSSGGFPNPKNKNHTIADDDGTGQGEGGGGDHGQHGGRRCAGEHRTNHGGAAEAGGVCAPR